MSHLSDSEIDGELDKAVKGREMARKRSVAFKTVDTFAGITRRRLWLKDAGKDKGACTDGHAIQVDFGDTDFYRLVEHELAHILFQSDSLARKQFIQEYVGRVVEVTKRAGVDINAARFTQQMGTIINILEDHRINSLWGLLYPGSYQELVALAQIDAEQYSVPNATKSLLSYMLCIHAGMLDVDSRFSKFKPFIQEAFRKVERRGFGATLLATKWLVTQLVSELVRRAQKQKSPKAPQTTTGYNPAARATPVGGGSGSSAAGGKQSAKGKGKKGKRADQDDQDDQDLNQGGDQDQDQDDQDQDQDNDQDQDAGEGWYPPPADADIQQRAEALRDLADMSGGEEAFDDVKDPAFPSKKDVQDAQSMANQVTGLDANDADTMEDYLSKSASQMDEILDAAKNAMRQTMTEDDWVKKDAMAKVVFKDVQNDERAHEIDPEDRTAIRRLRAQFFRIMGKTKTALAEAGSEIDIPAYLAGLATGDWQPCFKHEVRGQGFKGLALLDRSGSMSGEKTRQTERACRIINQATRFPFVDLEVWGFKSSTNGQVDIDRYDREHDSFANGEQHVGGVTPLHIAIRLGVRALEKGNEAKHLFIITDGFPVYTRRDGREFPTWQLMMYVRDEVQEARKNGIGVSCLFIGNGGSSFDVTPKQMHFMFGHQKSWRMVNPDRLGSDIVQLVSTGFVDYLKRG